MGLVGASALGGLYVHELQSDLSQSRSQSRSQAATIDSLLTQSDEQKAMLALAQERLNTMGTVWYLLTEPSGIPAGEKPFYDLVKQVARAGSLAMGYPSVGPGEFSIELPVYNPEKSRAQDAYVMDVVTVGRGVVQPDGRRMLSFVQEPSTGKHVVCNSSYTQNVCGAMAQLYGKRFEKPIITDFENERFFGLGIRR